MLERFKDNPFEIRGKEAMTEKQASVILRKVEKQRVSSELPLKGEIKKNPEHLRQIRLVNDILRGELEELGIGGFQALKPEQFHFLRSPAFEKASEADPFENVAGNYFADTDAIYVRQDWRKLFHPWKPNRKKLESLVFDIELEGMNEEAEQKYPYPEASGKSDPKASLRYAFIDDMLVERIEAAHKLQKELLEAAVQYSVFPVVLHEAIHAVGKQNMSVRGRRTVFRTGYNMPGKIEGREGLRDYFRALNEAVVEKMAMEMLEKNSELIERPGLTVFDMESQNEDYDGLLFPPDVIEERLRGGSYGFERKVLDIILGKIAVLNSESVDEVWRRFKRGYVTGDTMHLLDIEKAFGKGVMRVYANILPLSEEVEDEGWGDDEYDELYGDYDEDEEDEEEGRHQSLKESSAEDSELKQDILEFFTTWDKERRVELGKKILKEEENELRLYLARADGKEKKRRAAAETAKKKA